MNNSGSKEADKSAFAYDLLEKVGIDSETADRKILKLSGGEQQRVGYGMSDGKLVQMKQK